MKVIDGGKMRIAETLGKNKLLLLALAAGLVLLLVPFGSGKEEKSETDLTAPVFSLKDEEARLKEQLEKISGAGRVSVLLSVGGSASRELAQSGDETLVVSSGSGKGEEVVVLYYVNPEYTGAVIVCDGASSSSVRLEITRAVASFTGLSTDKIRVIQMV